MFQKTKHKHTYEDCIITYRLKDINGKLYRRRKYCTACGYVKEHTYKELKNSGDCDLPNKYDNLPVFNLGYVKFNYFFQNAKCVYS